MTDADAERLIAVWSALQTMRPQTSGAGLGYRGCTISEGARRWHAFEGIAIMTSGAAAEIRADTSRVFERAILATAPAGTIPEAVRF